MYVLDLLTSDSFGIFSKPIARKIGLENAILLGLFCYYQKSFKGEKFYREKKQLLEDSCLSTYALRTGLTELSKKGFIKIERKGIPAKNYYTVNAETIIDFLDIRTTRCVEFNTTGRDENNTTGEVEIDICINNKKENNNINNKEYNLISKEEYKEEIPYKAIVDYLNERIGTHYLHTSAKTRELIKARFNQGFNINDFKSVIDKKAVEWLNTDMKIYLRPETLFSNKFESYLNQLGQKKTTKDLVDTLDFSRFLKG